MIKKIKIGDYSVVVDTNAEIKINDPITDTYRVWHWRDDCSLLGRHKVIFADKELKIDVPTIPSNFKFDK